MKWALLRPRIILLINQSSGAWNDKVISLRHAAEKTQSANFLNWYETANMFGILRDKWMRSFERVFYCWYEHFCHESGDKQFIGHSSFNLLIWLFACQEIPSSSAEYFHRDFLHQWDEKSSETDCKRTGQKNPPLHAKIITINHSNAEWWRILLFSFFLQQVLF